MTLGRYMDKMLQGLRDAASRDIISGGQIDQTLEHRYNHNLTADSILLCDRIFKHLVDSINRGLYY